MILLHRDTQANPTRYSLTLSYDKDMKTTKKQTMAGKMVIPLGKSRNLTLDKTGAMYQTAKKGESNRYLIHKGGLKFSYSKGGENK